jgi:cell division protein FtsN
MEAWSGAGAVEVFAAPAPLDHGGRWCVQIGAFKNEKGAFKLRDQLTRKYRTANVIEFTGPTGHWVRIRPLDDDKGRAVEIARDLSPAKARRTWFGLIDVARRQRGADPATLLAPTSVLDITSLLLRT